MAAVPTAPEVPMDITSQPVEPSAATEAVTEPSMTTDDDDDIVVNTTSVETDPDDPVPHGMERKRKNDILETRRDQSAKRARVNSDKRKAKLDTLASGLRTNDSNMPCTPANCQKLSRTDICISEGLEYTSQLGSLGFLYCNSCETTVAGLRDRIFRHIWKGGKKEAGYTKMHAKNKKLNRSFRRKETPIREAFDKVEALNSDADTLRAMRVRTLSLLGVNFRVIDNPNFIKYFLNGDGIGGSTNLGAYVPAANKGETLLLQTELRDWRPEHQRDGSGRSVPVTLFYDGSTEVTMVSIFVANISIRLLKHTAWWCDTLTATLTSSNDSSGCDSLKSH